MGSILTAITVILQSAPVFLPGIGLALSPLSTLPIAIAANLSFSLGISIYIASVFILLLIHLQEATIFIFTTGILGLVFGALYQKKSFIFSLLISNITLSMGILSLVYLIGIMNFVIINNSFLITILMIFIFSLIYTWIWSFILNNFFKYFKLINFK